MKRSSSLRKETSHARSTTLSKPYKNKTKIRKTRRKGWRSIKQCIKFLKSKDQLKVLNTHLSSILKLKSRCFNRSQWNALKKVRKLFPKNQAMQLTSLNPNNWKNLLKSQRLGSLPSLQFQPSFLRSKIQRQQEQVMLSSQ